MMDDSEVAAGLEAARLIAAPPSDACAVSWLTPTPLTSPPRPSRESPGDVLQADAQAPWLGRIRPRTGTTAHIEIMTVSESLANAAVVTYDPAQGEPRTDEPIPLLLLAVSAEKSDLYDSRGSEPSARERP